MSSNLSRRNLAKGAAWATPVVLATTAVPAYSASCTTVEQTYKTLSWTSATGRDAGGTATGQEGLFAQFISANSFTRVRSENMTLARFGNGLNRGPWIMLNQANYSSSGGASQTVRITLPEDAYCVSFYISDIDSQYDRNVGAYRDSVFVSGGFIASAVDPSMVTVSGASAYASRDAYTDRKTTEYELPVTSQQGAVKFSYSSSVPLRTFDITYSNTGGRFVRNVNGTQQVYISAVTYSTDSACAGCVQ